MDYVLTILIDLILDEGVNASKNNRLPKGVRYFIFAFVLLLYIAIIGLITIIGITSLKENLVEGILALLFAACVLLVCILRFKAVYKNKKEKLKK